ncbi:MAG: phosphoglycerate kinase [Coriobacteriia bacterium]|nr:phosphoglycerate kinase [Coriobacteriia bacterium]
MRLVNEAELEGKRVLLRVDFNVPVKDGKVTDDTRIRSVLPTLRFLIDNRARVIIIAHQGRPKGQGYERAHTLEPVAACLGGLLNKEVRLTHDVLGLQTTQDVNDLPPGGVLMLENLRFDVREKENRPDFARALANLADVYVDDAFAAVHRAHASIVGITEFLPSYSGFLLYREIETFNRMLERPERPFVAILGGSKVSDKIKVLDALLEKVDALIIGGAMCFTLLAAQGYAVGASFKEDDWVAPAAKILEKSEQLGVQILLPSDIVVASSMSETADTLICPVSAIPEGMIGLDIGPATVEFYAQKIAEARTVFWNGPMGVFEMDAFANGTRKIATAVAMNQKAVTIVGGGDSIAALNKFGYNDLVSFISTGGGAALELLEGATLPGIAALEAD